MFKYKRYVVTLCAFCGTKYFYNDDFSIVSESISRALIEEIENVQTKQSSASNIQVSTSSARAISSSPMIVRRASADKQAANLTNKQSRTTTTTTANQSSTALSSGSASQVFGLQTADSERRSKYGTSKGTGGGARTSAQVSEYESTKLTKASKVSKVKPRSVDSGGRQQSKSSELAKEDQRDNKSMGATAHDSAKVSEYESAQLTGPETRASKAHFTASESKSGSESRAPMKEEQAGSKQLQVARKASGVHTSAQVSEYESTKLTKASKVTKSQPRSVDSSGRQQIKSGELAKEDQRDNKSVGATTHDSAKVSEYESAQLTGPETRASKAHFTASESKSGSESRAPMKEEQAGSKQLQVARKASGVHTSAQVSEYESTKLTKASKVTKSQPRSVDSSGRQQIKSGELAKEDQRGSKSASTTAHDERAKEGEYESGYESGAETRTSKAHFTTSESKSSPASRASIKEEQSGSKQLQGASKAGGARTSAQVSEYESTKVTKASKSTKSQPRSVDSSGRQQLKSGELTKEDQRGATAHESAKVSEYESAQLSGAETRASKAQLTASESKSGSANRAPTKEEQAGSKQLQGSKVSRSTTAKTSEYETSNMIKASAYTSETVGAPTLSPAKTSPASPLSPGGTKRRKAKYRYTTTTTTLTAERQRQEERRQRAAAEAAEAAQLEEKKKRRRKEALSTGETGTKSASSAANQHMSNTVSLNLSATKSQTSGGPKPTYEEYEKKKKKKF